MRIRMLTALCGAATLIPCLNASAVFHGLSVVSVGGAPSGRVAWQIFATFTDPNDYLLGVFGDQVGGALTLESRGLGGVGVGTPFYNPISSHGNAPTPYDVFGGFGANTNVIPPVTGAKYDSFYTIGRGAGQTGSGPFGDDTLAFNMPVNFVSGTAFSTASGGWYTDGPKEQGRAGWIGDGDATLRVLILQLTVAPLASVWGTVNIQGLNDSPLAGQQPFTANGLTFSTPAIPGPASLIVLGLAGLFGSSRRRA